MDPTTTLMFMRSLARKLRSGDFDAGDEELDAHALFLGAFEDLDEWISKGGFPPESWASAFRRANDAVQAANRAARGEQ
jgi:hypothetical protein